MMRRLLALPSLLSIALVAQPALAQVPVRAPLAPKSMGGKPPPPKPPPPVVPRSLPDSARNEPPVVTGGKDGISPELAASGGTPGSGRASITPAGGGDDTKGKARAAGRAKGRFQLDFDKAEISDVVQTIADFTGKLFIVPENIRGKITIVGPEDGTGYVTADEAYAAFLAALEANNWTVYPVGRYLKLVEKRAAASNNVWTYLDPKADLPDDERMVTKIIKLHYIDADAIQAPLKQLLSKDHQLTAFPPDTLIVTEVSLNLRRVEKILAALDQPGGGEELRILQIEFANAADIAEKLLAVFEEKAAGGKAGKKAAGAKGVAAAASAAAGDKSGPTGSSDSDGLEGGSVSISRVIPDERTNKLIIVANTKSFQRIEDLIRQLDVPTGDTGKVNVHYLKNANAEDVASTLSALTQGGAPAAGGARAGRKASDAKGAAPGGAAKANEAAELFGGEVKISADKSTNSLVIVASAQDYKSLVKVVEKLDIPRRQVFVEAVIMEVNLRKVNEFGMSLHGGYAIETDEGIAPLILGSQTGKASSLNLASLVSLGGFMAGLQGPPIPASAELGVSLPAFGVVMHALAKSSDVNVLSTPHILTSDNEEAEITVGQNVPFQAGFAPPGLSNLSSLAGGTTGTNAASAGALTGLLGGGLGSMFAPIQRQNVELKLKIKPQINESDYVRMEVEEQTEEIAEQDPQLGPTTAKRTAKTVIVARDQTTVVIGGLIQDRTINSVTKTPFLGDIPVLGWLFRDNQSTKLKTNLLLFLTPYIIQDQGDFRRIFERKMREREEFIAAFYGTPLGYDVPIDYARKAGPAGTLVRTVDAEKVKIENGGVGAPGEKAVAPRDATTPPSSSATEPAAAPAEDAAPEAP